MAAKVLIVPLLLLSRWALANSCCGQSPASFPVLNGDQQLSVTAAYSFINSQGRVFNDDAFYLWDGKKRQLQSLQFNVASAIAESQQVYLSSAFMQGRYADATEDDTAHHLSDTQLGYSYEVLPEYTFSLWRPVIYLSAIANLPTGKSIYDEASLSEGADVTGHNQWGVGLGLTLRKVYYPLTLTLQLKSLRLFSKQFTKVKASEFSDNSVALLATYATRFYDFSLNAGLTMTRLGSRNVATAGNLSNPITADPMENSTVLIGLQKPLGESWTAGVNYADQTWLGPARNSILTRSFNVYLNYNYF